MCKHLIRNMVELAKSGASKLGEIILTFYIYMKELLVQFL